MADRYLIINADDFGVCPATNQAVEDAFEGGVLTSTTVMSPCPASRDAIRRAASNPAIRMGLHITTTAEWARKWGPVADGVPSLLDEQGMFFPTSEAFAARASPDELAKEIEAQYQFAVAHGAMPTHADSHMGSVYGLSGHSFMKQTLDFCARHNLPFRFPRNAGSAAEIVHMRQLPAPILALHQQAVGYADSLGVKLIDNLFTCTAPFSELTCYEKLKAIYFAIVSDLPEGVSEVFLHPSLGSSPLAEGNPKWPARMWEHRLLLDQDFKAHIEREKIRLVSYQNAPFR